jgi:hypothetical protein
MAALLVLLVIVAGGWALAYFSVPLLRWTLAGGLLLVVLSLAAPAWWLYPLWLFWGLVAGRLEDALPAVHRPLDLYATLAEVAR